MSGKNIAGSLQGLGCKLEKILTFEPVDSGAQYKVAGIGHRSGLVGVCVGIIGFRKSGGYEVLLRFPDGSVEPFPPMALFCVQKDVTSGQYPRMVNDA